MGLLEKDKRKFTVIIGSKKCGVSCGAGPSLAAKKVKGKSGAFYLKETTKGSKKKLYGPYSSKKKVVQRGGILREDICEIVLKILEQCDEEQGFVDEMLRINNKYKILETTYVLLGIRNKRNKCDILKEILKFRISYKTKNNRDFNLCHCLCSDDKNISVIESQYCMEHSKLIKDLVDDNWYNFHDNNWIKFINFLRITIREIEKSRKHLQNYLKINEMRREKLRDRLKNIQNIQNEENYYKMTKEEQKKYLNNKNYELQARLRQLNEE